MKKAKVSRKLRVPISMGNGIKVLVKAKNAQKPVLVNGCAEHALKAYPGVTVGCALSNVFVDNAAAFPHPVLMANVTKRTVAIVTKKDPATGLPSEAVMYEHYYGGLTDKNDDRTLKTLVKKNPQIMERSFLLHPPQRQERKGGAPRAPRPGASPGGISVPRTVLKGAEKRAAKAGIAFTPAALSQLRGVG